MLWQSAFNSFSLPADVQKILVLGVGGGTVIKLLATKYPEAQITGVDIDQTIINIAKTYFELSELQRLSFRTAFDAGRNPLHKEISRFANASLEMTNADALKFLPQEIKAQRCYDLVVVDLFSGREIPAFVSTHKFIQNIKHVLRPHGQFVINYLREHEYAPRAQALYAKYKHNFPVVNKFEINNNAFFRCIK